MKINVLDKGYIRLADKLGSDLSVVNAARVSYDKESAELNEKDQKLIDFLIREGHTSPFRHAALTFEIYAPLFVARQWWKYAVASSHVDDQNGWNESSRRYITENEEFYIPEPDKWRSKPANSKQGSGEPIEDLTGGYLTTQMEEAVFHGIKMYNYALDQSVAPEIARLFLPAYAMYVRWRWTVSLQGVITFLDQRLPNDAQFEIREYAGAVAKIVEQEFPYTWKAWNKDSAY
jgi:thymidylate synthase (FAD)